ncbi:MAG TPA: transcriptional regulator [Bacteroidetes bacterium]|nr:transcriptional regulator [Bacteroidota bacterium]
MEKFRIENILKIAEIENELELEQANSMFNRLRLLLKDDPSLGPLRSHLAELIEKYEATNWENEENVDKAQLLESENAEKIVRNHDQFIQRRKEIIRAKLNAKDLIQNDLADILGHRKNYMSELINGLRPFSQEDIIIIHRLLGIKLDDLIIPVVKKPTANRIRSVIQKLNNPRFKFNGDDFNLEFT